MNAFAFEIGSIVRASYKTGEYIGEVVEISSPAKPAVKILAVLKHPEQGDLHHPMNPDVPFFHQRRALAEGEIALMPRETIRPYHGTVPGYAESLKQALQTELDRLDSLSRWAERCTAELKQLEREYRL